MIYFTGDTHCPLDISKLNTTNWPDQKQCSKEDVLFICGDFGGVWDGSKTDKCWLDWFERKNVTVVFCDGNHENFDLLNQYPIKEWMGGKVHEIRPSVFHLIRGEGYEIEGKKIFVLGGADSHDKDRRTEGVNWWKEERPSDEELLHARQTLDRLNWEVDLVVTHTAPTKVVRELGYTVEGSSFQRFLDEMSVCLTFEYWVFGHFHRDVQIGSYIGLFEQVLSWEQLKK